MTATKELPDRPSLENLRKQAKALHRQITNGDGEAVARARQHLPRLGSVDAADVAAAGVTLQEVQYIIAVEYGYGKWQDLLACLGEKRPRNWPRKIPIRPGLPNLERDASMLHQAAQEGRPWCASRFRARVARLEDVSDDEIGGAGVTLEEARQVIAADYGYASWADLNAEVGRLRPVHTFESLADLDDAEIREIIVRLGRDRLSVALKTVSERFKERFSANMTGEVGDLLHELGYTLQAHRKSREGTQHPDRDAQFHYLSEQVQQARQRGEPAISVDTKKKELVGDFKNPGREWRPKGTPERVRVHDFIIPEQGKAIPYGIYELQALTEAMKELGPMPLTKVEAVQLEILRKFRSDDPLV